MRTLNLGILAHVDAGKTSLTERLLYAAGVIDTIGRVDDGSTRTDSLALERQRGITIKAAVVSFGVRTPDDDVTVNLIDTPGHPDFIAEVERVLSVLDGVVLVVSAVEGVQAQTRVLMRALQRLRIPTLIFVNKIDRGGADPERVLSEIAERLSPAVVAMGAVQDQGARDADVRQYGPDDAAFRSDLAALLADHDDGLLAAYVDNPGTIPFCRLRTELAAQSAKSLVHPVYFGSAITGAGVDALTAGIVELLPAARGDADGPVSGTIFKVERGPSGEKIAYVRMFAGGVRVRDRIRIRPEVEQKVTAIGVFDRGAIDQRASVTAGQIGILRGLTEVRIGDTIGLSRADSSGRHFAPPTLETIVVPSRPGDAGALVVALTQLAEQDPLIDVRTDDVRHEIAVSLYGEVQKEVIQATLAADFGLEVDFRETTTICVERPIGTGTAVEVIKQEPNPFLATVGLRVEPGEIGSGVRFQLAPEILGTMPVAYFKAVEDTVRETLRQGVYGWQVADCVVTMTHAGYAPRTSIGHNPFDKSMSSTGADFRGLTPLVLLAALQDAGVRVYEPLHRFHLELQADTFGTVAPVLARLRAVPHSQEIRGTTYVLEGEIPAAAVHELQQQLPALTRGEGVLESAFERYQPVEGATIPTRPRTDHNPLNRKEYLLHVTRRV